MKWLGGLAGLLFGLAVSRFEDAVGWMLGGFLAGGAIDFFRGQRGTAAPLSKSAPDSSESAGVFKALEDVHWRLKRLEDQARLPVSPMERDLAGGGTGVAPAEPAEEVFAEPSLAATNATSASAEATLASVDPSTAEAADTPLPLAPTVAPHASAVELAKGWLLGGNSMLKAGIIILFFGVAFLIKYAAERGVLPVELRLAGVAAGGIALLVFGFRLRNRIDGKAAYGLALQGAGVGVLYLVIFGAFRLYHLLPGGFAFALMVMVVGLSAALAVMQNSLALAAFGAAGGFMAPILASTGGGSHVGLFSFYALLNAGIFAIAWFKPWRVLNLLGFGFTFGVATLWGARAYRPEYFATTEPFLVLFFLFYVAIAVFYALREAPRLRSVVDGTLVFGTPMVAFGLQAALVRDMEYGAAFSAVAVALLYLLLTQWLQARKRDDLRLLAESFLALGVIFITLAVPLALDGRWTSAVWAVEGAAIVWAGSRQGKLLARAFGFLVQSGGAIAVLSHWGDGDRGPLPVLNAQWLGLVLVAAAALFTARLISRHPERFSKSERGAAPIIFIAGLAAWLMAGVGEIARWSDNAAQAQRVALFMAGTAWLFHLLARRFDWRHASRVPPALLPALIPVLLWSIDVNRHPFALFGWLIWPIAIASHYRLLKAAESKPEGGAPGAYAGWLHALGVWVLALIGALELHWLARAQQLRDSAWSVAAVLLPVALTGILFSSGWMRRRWPVAVHPRAVLIHGVVPLVLVMWLWVLYANLSHDGSSAPLPYLPLLNAIDLGHLLGLVAVATWMQALKAESLEPPITRVNLLAAGGAAAFIWLNGMLLRTIHQWTDVPYRLDALLRSVLTQTALSIFWTVLALTLVLVATRLAVRTLWFTGAVLMVVVVVKLFLVDLSNIGGIERIVSFIGVGLLMLVIGYVAPLPPKAREDTVVSGERT